MTWTTRPRSEAGALSGIAAGEGPPIVLLHGVGLRAEAWNAQLDALSPRARCLALDLPGHGESPALPGAPSLAEYSEAVAACLGEGAVVIGHSFGAMIALDCAIRHPGLVRGVAALNAVHRRSPEARASVMARAGGLDGHTPADPAQPIARWFGDAPSSARDACERWLRAVDPAGYKAAYQVFAREDGPSDAGLAALRCPALFLTGAEEPNSTPDMSRAMADLAPKGRAEIIERAAHMMPMTHAPAVNAALARFLEECSL
ncbi:alpha/beta fold hydrolase [Roseovarius aquimarinus]|uniref:Alpha/beta fold hydrolase n=1 Tax=Roseovarius aquimarinus TaxID=1229156 RepID=A0ABW7I799_9RHOB